MSAIGWSVLLPALLAGLLVAATHVPLGFAAARELRLGSGAIAA
jgi:hypothetical protein